MVIAYLNINSWHIFSTTAESPTDDASQFMVTSIFTDKRSASVTLQMMKCQFMMHS